MFNPKSYQIDKKLTLSYPPPNKINYLDQILLAPKLLHNPPQEGDL